MAPRSVTLIALLLVAYTHASEHCEESSESCGDEEKDGASLLQAISSIEEVKKAQKANAKVEERVAKTHVVHQHQHKKADEEKKVDAGRRWGSDKGPYYVEGSVVTYQAKYVLPATASAAGFAPPMEVGNPSNMDPKLKELGLDFEGIWWMSDNPVPEELVSFANTMIKNNSDGSPWPATLMVPNSRKGMWSWRVDWIGYILRKYYATGDPDAHTDFVFFNTTQGQITTGLTEVPFVLVDRFPFYKYTTDCDKTSGDSFLCDPNDCAEKLNTWGITSKTCKELIEEYPDDMWSRPTLFQDGSWFSDTTYTLKRIVRGDGTPHPVFWEEFMRHMTKHNYDWFGRFVDTDPPGEVFMQSYASDTWCERQHDATWGLAGCR